MSSPALISAAIQLSQRDAEKILKVGVEMVSVILEDRSRANPVQQMLTCLPQGVLNRLRMSRNYREQNSRRTVGPRPSLLPVPQSGWLETKLRGESRLAQTQMFAGFTDIDSRHLHSGNTNRNILAFDPIHGFLETGDYRVLNSFGDRALGPYCRPQPD